MLLSLTLVCDRRARKDGTNLISIQYNIRTASNTEFNRHIKIIAKLAVIVGLVKFSYKKQGRNFIETKPKYQWVTSHPCRRSFCTNE
jgi:hypothetical protein